jgi:hypothetical protein
MQAVACGKRAYKRLQKVPRDGGKRVNKNGSDSRHERQRIRKHREKRSRQGNDDDGKKKDIFQFLKVLRWPRGSAPNSFKKKVIDEVNARPKGAEKTAKDPAENGRDRRDDQRDKSKPGNDRPRGDEGQKCVQRIYTKKPPGVNGIGQGEAQCNEKRNKKKQEKKRL